MSTLARLCPSIPWQTAGASRSQCRELTRSAVALGSASGKKGSSGGGAKKATGRIKAKVYEKPPVKRVEPHALVKLDPSLFRRQHLEQLQVFSPPELTEKVVGTRMAFPSDKLSPNAIFGIPKALEQEFLHADQPYSMIRQSTLDILKEVDNLSSKTSTSSRQAVLTGPAGCGKSVLLLQAVNYCALNEWIVYYAPRTIEWVDATSEYSFDYRSRLFHQYNIAATALARIVQANEAKLQKIHLRQDTPMPGGKAGAVLREGTTLDVLASVGTKEPALAPQTLVLLFEALAQQTQYPFLIAVDDFQALYNTTHYLDPQFKAVNSYHLSMPRLILEYASGQRKLARGAVLGALSLSDSRFPVRLELHEALGLGWGAGQEPSPYDKRSKSMQIYSAGLRAIPAPPKFSPTEAALFFESFKGRLLNNTFNDSFFLAKYSESNGNPREMLSRGITDTMQV